jgi:hypothetical protein
VVLNENPSGDYLLNNLLDWDFDAGHRCVKPSLFQVQLNSVANGTVYDSPPDPTNGDPYSPAFGFVA